MKYTIIFKNQTVFYSDWYDYENNWNEDFHFMIINNISHQFTIDGKTWIGIEDDHL